MRVTSCKSHRKDSSPLSSSHRRQVNTTAPLKTRLKTSTEDFPTLGEALTNAHSSHREDFSLPLNKSEENLKKFSDEPYSDDKDTNSPFHPSSKNHTISHQPPGQEHPSIPRLIETTYRIDISQDLSRLIIDNLFDISLAVKKAIVTQQKINEIDDVILFLRSFHDKIFRRIFASIIDDLMLKLDRYNEEKPCLLTEIAHYIESHLNPLPLLKNGTLYHTTLNDDNLPHDPHEVKSIIIYCTAAFVIGKRPCYLNCYTISKKAWDTIYRMRIDSAFINAIFERPEVYYTGKNLCLSQHELHQTEQIYQHQNKDSGVLVMDVTTEEAHLLETARRRPNLTAKIVTKREADLLDKLRTNPQLKMNLTAFLLILQKDPSLAEMMLSSASTLLATDEANEDHSSNTDTDNYISTTPTDYGHPEYYK